MGGDGGGSWHRAKQSSGERRHAAAVPMPCCRRGPDAEQAIDTFSPSQPKHQRQIHGAKLRFANAAVKPGVSGSGQVTSITGQMES
jgi:hypothetical protein